jgi:glycosyltransferase involved in cell wall biosynthesis
MKPDLYSVLPRPPHPTRDGLAIRNFHLLRALAAEFEVHAFALKPSGSAGSGEYPPGIGAEEIPRSGGRARRTAALAGSVFSGEAFPVVLYRSRRLGDALKRRISQRRPAWIVAHSYHVAGIALDAGSPVWVDFHNVDSEIWRRMSELTGGSRAAALKWQAPRVARAERSIAGRAAGISCVSDRDASALRAAGAVEPLVVPNGVDLERYAYRSAFPSEQRVLFVGDLSWPPNAEGVAWFCEEIWPLVARLAPAARMEILGRGASGRFGKFRRQTPPRVTFLGEQGDTRPFLDRAAVAVVPLRAGGGTRLKILEAAACGVPVVSTPLGAEGLELAEGSEIRLADRAEEFAAAVAGLLADPEARRAQAEAARRAVEGRYDWRSIGERLAAELARRARVQ